MVILPDKSGNNADEKEKATLEERPFL